MSGVLLRLSGTNGAWELPAELSLRGRLLRLTYTLADSAEESLLFTLDREGRPLSLRRSSSALSMSFEPGKSCEGFMETPLGRVGLVLLTEALTGRLSAEEGHASLRFRLQPDSGEQTLAIRYTRPDR